MSLLMTIELDFSDVKVVKELSPERYQELRQRVPALELPEDQADMYDYSTYRGVGFFCDLEYLDSLGCKPRVSRIRGQFAEALPKLGVPEQKSSVQVVNVTIPNMALFSVQTVTVLEDACTNYLQQYLDRGWRLIAVCPPNDCRRPTYVLGHMNAKEGPL